MIRTYLVGCLFLSLIPFDAFGQTPDGAPESEIASASGLADVPKVARLERLATESNRKPEALDSPAWQARKSQIDHCLTNYYIKHVNADDLRPWSIMHGIIAYGQDAMITSQGYKVSAVDYLCANGMGDDRRMLFIEHEQLKSKRGRGLQGHSGQLLAILAQSDVAYDYSIEVQGKPFSVVDLIEAEKKSCEPDSELTFQLIALSHYLKSDFTWKNSKGQSWSIPRLIREEIAQPINGAACGGTHRLMALSYAVKKRQERGEPINGQWERAAKVVRNYQNMAFRLQNPDGSFSTEWFEGRGLKDDDLRRLYTTGHILEWLVYSLPDERLYDEKLTRAVDFLMELLAANAGPERQLDGQNVGPTGHAIRALRLYEQRAFGEVSNYQRLAETTDWESGSPTVISEAQLEAGMKEDTSIKDDPIKRNNNNQKFLRRGIFGRKQ